jgi:predicted outer membrane repeat protein
MYRIKAALCIASAAGSSLAQETFVVPGDVATLQDALNPAISGIDPGDIIVLRDTITHFGTFDVTIPNLTIRAADSESPVIDANGAGSVIKVNIGNGNLSLEGLTIQDGSRIGNNDRGSGVEVVNAELVTIRDCIIRNNDANDTGGGGVGGSNFDLLVERCVFQENNSNNGGAIFLNGGSGLTIRNTQFLQNTSTNNGGGIFYESNANHALLIEDSVFEDNACIERGGAILMRDAGQASITNTGFAGNTAIGRAGSDAGAIFIDGVQHTEFTGCDFEANLANGEGGAILSTLNTPRGDLIEYIDTRFVNHESSASTVAIFGGIVDVVNCEFLHNTSLRAGDGERFGGAIRYRNNQAGQRSSGRVYNSVFVGNSAQDGGAIALGTSTVDITNCTFVNNTAERGSAIRGLVSGMIAAVSNNVFAQHAPDTLSFNGGTRVVRFNLFDTSELIDGEESNNLFGIDPRFVDAANGDYTLRSNSPAIDAGNSMLYELGVFSDSTGSLRVQDDPNTSDFGVSRTGPVIDMGAFEFDVAGAPSDCPADLNGDGVLNFFDVSAFLTAFNAGCP